MYIIKRLIEDKWVDDDGPRNNDDPLLDIYRIADVDEFYSHNEHLTAPFIMSPSHVKFVYAPQVLDFWFGLGRAGGWNLGIAIIGFSLPKDDDYVRIGLFNLIDNYQVSWWNQKLFDNLKENIKLIDLRKDDASVSEYKKRFRFVDEGKANYFLSGFGSDAVKFLYSKVRT